MSAAPMARPRRARPKGPSSRYPTLVCDGERVTIAGGDSLEVDGPEHVTAAARQLAGGVESVVWIHKDALELWRAPHAVADGAGWAAMFGGGRALGPLGWLVQDGPPAVHLAPAPYLGDFAGAGDALELGRAVERWRQHVGIAYLISGPSTVHKLIKSSAPVPPLEEPEPYPTGHAACAWAYRSNTWEPLADLDALAAAGRRWVRLFDRSGSYLSAWRGVNLAAGPWEQLGAGVIEPGPEPGRPPGYWLVDVDELEVDGWLDPFRRHGDAPGPRWITTPLLQLALDLRGGPVLVQEALVSPNRCRALDAPSSRLADARTALVDDETAASRVTLAALKNAYAGATAWFENGPKPPDPLARPSWRHTVLDRFAANTYRSLRAATPAPFATGDVDAAAFAFANADDVPDGIRLGGLGGWKPKGAALPIEVAAAVYSSGGFRALTQAAEAGQ